MLKNLQNIMEESLWKFEDTTESNFYIDFLKDFPGAFYLPEKIIKVIHQDA